MEAIPKCTMIITNKYALDTFCNFLLLHSLGVFHILTWAQTSTQGAGQCSPSSCQNVPVQ